MKPISRMVNDDNPIRLMVVLPITSVDYPFCTVRALFALTKIVLKPHVYWIKQVF